MPGEGNSCVAKRTRGALKDNEHKKRPEDHPNLRWTGVDRAKKRALNDKLKRLCEKEIHVPRIVDWRIIKNLGCFELLEDMLLVRMVFSTEIVTSTMWKRALEIREPIYKEWCLEFLSSVKVEKEIRYEGMETDPFINFRLGGENMRVSLIQFGRMLGLISKEEACDGKLIHLIKQGERTKGDFDAAAYWEEIGGEDVRVYGKKRVWKIRNPMLQVLHKLLVQLILHRSYYEQYVLDDDLWILHAFDKKHPLRHLNVIWIIAQHLGNGAKTARSTFMCCGHIITRIAKSMGLFNDEEMDLLGELVITKPVDMRSFWSLSDDCRT